jgi:hypothetical protein
MKKVPANDVARAAQKAFVSISIEIFSTLATRIRFKSILRTLALAFWHQHELEHDLCGTINPL